MIRRFQRRRYLFVLIVTIMVFSLGLLLGIVINEKKVNIINKIIADQQLDYLSLQLQFTYLSSLDVGSKEGCKVMNTALKQSWTKLDDAYTKMVKYKNSPESDPETIQVLERNDMLNNLRYWFLLKKAEDYCSLKDSVSALFFFIDEGCPDCDDQSTLLEHYKTIFGDRFLLFHINVEIDDPMVQLLLNQYDIKIYPTTIIGDLKFGGPMYGEDLKKIICSQFNEAWPECKI